MACSGMGATILFTKNLDRAIEFYTIMGIELNYEKHGDGPVHYTKNLNGVHFAIFEGEGESPRQDYRSKGSTLIGFKVDDVDGVYKGLMEKGFESLWEPKDCHWGRTARAYDPDGRPVEFFE